MVQSWGERSVSCLSGKFCHFCVVSLYSAAILFVMLLIKKANSMPSMTFEPSYPVAQIITPNVDAHHERCTLYFFKEQQSSKKKFRLSRLTNTLFLFFAPYPIHWMRSVDNSKKKLTQGNSQRPSEKSIIQIGFLYKSLASSAKEERTTKSTRSKRKIVCHLLCIFVF